MFKKFLVIATLAAGLISTQASAEFIHTDWKVVGDAQATLDPATGLEWLKLNNTAAKSLNMVRNEISTLYQGWRLPTEAEVMQLFRNLLGANYAYLDGATATQRSFFMPTEARIIARTFLGDSGGGTAYGWYEFQTIPNSIAGSGLWTNSYWYNWTYSPSQAVRSGTGVFLVSDGGATLSSINNPSLNINNPNAPVNMADVSTPTGLAAACALILMFGARRRAA